MREMEIATGTALWYQSPIPPVAIRWVLVRDPRGQYEPMALLCTDQQAEAHQIVEWFVLRWSVEVTTRGVRAHLGVETQRQWSDLAILRTTPALLALFSLVTVFAQQLLEGQPFPVRQAAWYSKALPTFADTLAFVRQHLWPSSFFSVSSSHGDAIQIPLLLLKRQGTRWHPFFNKEDQLAPCYFNNNRCVRTSLHILLFGCSTLLLDLILSLLLGEGCTKLPRPH